MEKGKISNHALWALMALNTCGTSILVVGASLSEFAKQDAWISVLLAAVAGLLIIWMYMLICSSFPDKTLIQIIQIIFGKWIGAFVVSVLIFFCFLNTAQLVSYVNGFMMTNFLPETPPYIINILFVAALMAAFLYGLESIARSAEIFIVFISVMFLLALLLFPKGDFNNILPVLENGVGPVLKGALYLSSFLTWPLFLMGFVFFSNTSNSKATKKSIFTGYLWGAFLIFIIVITSTLVLGSNISANSQYPTFLLAKEIEIKNVLTGVEGIVTCVWIFTIFFKTIMYFYGAVAGLTQLTGLKDYKKILLPLGLILLVFSGIVYPNTEYQVTFDTIVGLPYSFSVTILMPVILLILIKTKKWKKRSGEIKILEANQKSHKNFS